MKQDTEHGGGGAAGLTTAPTLADVLAYIEADSSLSATRRRDLRSSIKIVARVLDREAALIPALPSRLREEFAKVLPAAHISPKTWATVRCNVLSAIELSGLAKIVRTSRHTVTPEWHALWQLLPSKRLRNGLSRFFRYASAQGVSPAEVDDAVLESFKSDLDAHIVVRKPKTVHRDTAHLWNLAVATVPGFPGRKVTLPDYRPKPTRIDPALLASFIEELERYLAWCRVSDVFDPQARVRPLDATTLRLHRQHVISAATAAVAAGIEPSRLASLKDLLDPSIFKEILRHRHAMAGGEPNDYTLGLAKTLIAIASDWAKLDLKQIDGLKALVAKLPKLSAGLTEKNRKLLAWFDDTGNLARYLALPERLWAKAISGRLSPKRALLMAQDALLVGLQIHLALRRANLVRLEFGRHISWPGGPKRPALLLLPAAEMKNRQQPHEAEIGEPLAAQMWTYRERIVPAAVGTKSPYLFVKSDGTLKDNFTVALRFRLLMRKHLGLAMSLHQARHVLAKLELDNNPAAMELVRQLLGHSSIKTTVNFYGGTDTRRAVRHHNDLIQKLREETKSRLVRRRAGNAAPHHRTRHNPTDNSKRIDHQDGASHAKKIS